MSHFSRNRVNRESGIGAVVTTFPAFTHSTDLSTFLRMIAELMRTLLHATASLVSSIGRADLWLNTFACIAVYERPLDALWVCGESSVIPKSSRGSTRSTIELQRV